MTLPVPGNRRAPETLPEVESKRPGKRIRVLIADDHAVVRRGLAAIINLEDDVQVIGEVGDGMEAVAQWRQLRPDITLMDLRMPGMEGVEAIDRIRKEDPTAAIIVLTTFDTMRTSTPACARAPRPIS